MSYEDAMIDHNKVYSKNLCEPHFNEDASVVSARKVVPLSTVQVRESRGRVGLFITALLLAMLLGGATTGFLYSRRFEVASETGGQVTSEPSTSEADTSPETAGQTQQAGITGEQNNQTDGEASVDVVVEPEIASAREASAAEPKAKPSAKISKPLAKNDPPVVVDNDPGESYSEWEETRRRRVQERREQMIEERRQMRREYRREARRQRRDRWRNRDRSNDLFRIEEIFEGEGP